MRFFLRVREPIIVILRFLLQRRGIAKRLQRNHVYYVLRVMFISYTCHEPYIDTIRFVVSGNASWLR